MGNEKPDIRCACGPWGMTTQPGGSVYCWRDRHPDQGPDQIWLYGAKPSSHCSDCGARLTLAADGAVSVGKSVAELEADKLTVLAERDILRKRVAELEADDDA